MRRTLLRKAWVVGEVVVRKAVQGDARSIARFHRENISGGFLSSLGSPVLALLYETVTTSEGSFCVLAVRDGSPVGFVAGCLDSGRLYRDFLRGPLLRGLLALGPKLVRPRTRMRAVEPLFYPRKVAPSLPRAALLSIGVAKGYRGKGVSDMLFDALVREFRSQGVRRFKVVVGEGLQGAIAFSLFTRICGGARVHAAWRRRAAVAFWALRSRYS